MTPQQRNHGPQIQKHLSEIPALSPIMWSNHSSSMNLIFLMDKTTVIITISKKSFETWYENAYYKA